MKRFIKNVTLPLLAVTVLAAQPLLAMQENKQIIKIKEDQSFIYGQIAEKVFNKTLSDKELTIFAKQLLQQRIDHWKQKLKKADGNKDKIKNPPLFFV